LDFSFLAINYSFGIAGVDDKNDDNEIIYFIGFSSLTVLSVSVFIFVFFKYIIYLKKY
jgi:hypothetical protein